MREDYKKKLSGQIEKHFLNLEQMILEDIVRRIRKTGEITSTADWQINRLRIIGYSTEDIEKMIKDTLKLSYPEVFELYDKVIDWEYARNKDIYEQINADYIPYEENEELQQLTEGFIKQSNDELRNITQSMGFYLDYGNGKLVMTPLADVYQNYLDKAISGVIYGTFDYNTMIRKVVTQLTNSGLRYVDYASGWHNRIDVAARRAVMTGVSQLTGKISDMNADKLGTKHFEVAWHSGARPSHAAWQGKVWSKEQLITVCGLGTGPGLLGWNCYHEYYPFVKGISERNWTDEWLTEQNRKENTPKTFNGKEYTLYEAKQQQRKMETAMRAQREKVVLLKQGDADPDDVMLARAKYQGQLGEYARFCKKMGLTEERERIYYDMRGRIAPNIKYIKLSDSTDKWAKETVKKLLQSEKTLSERIYETMEIYSSDGKFIMAKRGKVDSVKLSLSDYFKLKNAVVTHNHPSGSSFSFTDLNFLKNMPISELRVSTPEGVYSIRKPKTWSKEINTSDKMKDVYEQIKKDLRPKYKELYNMGKINKKERHIMFKDEVNRVFAERFGIEYGFELYE